MKYFVEILVPIKDLKRLPKHVITKLQAWVNDVEDRGLPEVKKILGFHDEPIKGRERAGQRSIRLSKAYRAFYVTNLNGTITIINVIEVNKHDY